MLLHQCATLPDAGWLVLLAAGAAGLPWRASRVPAAFCLGLFWASLQAHAALAQRLPAALEGVDLAVAAEIVAVEPVRADYTRLLLRPQPVGDWRPRYLRVGWYGEPPDLVPGERWQLVVRLKQPNGLMNPGGFDYERWLFAQRIDATGYVRSAAEARRLDAGWSLGRLRHRIAARIAAVLADHPAQGVIIALAVGERGWITDAQWEALRITGTAHLVAISGLHVGLVALLTGALAARAWRLSARACRLRPARDVGVVVGMLTACGYALLAGFTLPTQRALLMLLVPAIALLARRRVRPWHGFGLALAAVLLWDPFAPLGAGFWLSFGAVALLLAIGLDRSRTGWLRTTVNTQLAVSVGLIPVSVLWLRTAAWLGPLANVWAIPLVGLVIVPLTLLGCVLLPLLPDGQLLQAAAWLMAPALDALSWLAERGPAADAAAVPGWAVAAAVLATVLLVLPRGVPGRWLALPLLLPVALARPAAPADEALRLTVLDVGQGQAIVAEAGGEALVYDTGPTGPGFDAAALALLPYLAHRGHDSVRWLVVSHADVDHSGGAAALLRTLPAAEVRVGEPVPGLPDAGRCRAGERVRWQEVELVFLWPTDGAGAGNDGSCVLRLTAAGRRILLPGDIGLGPERRLASTQAAELAADVLVVPHHGSAYASGAEFVRAVAPRYALVSAGYRNRYGFPRPEAVARYRAVGAELRVTAEEGALTVRVLRDGRLQVDGHRRQQGRYYHRRPRV